MSKATEVDRVYAAVEKAAALAGTTCAGDRVRPVLTGHQDLLDEAVIVFSMTASGSHSGGLDLSMTVPAGHVDPYSFALSEGLIEPTDHPVGSVISDFQERFPIGMYGIDVDVAGGFKKAYAAFPSNDLRELKQLFDLPSMPRAAAENAELFARYGLDRVTGVSVDYKRHELNLYCDRATTEPLDPDYVQSMLREMGLKEASEQGLEFAKKTFAIYPTLNWDSSEIVRICFAVITTDPATTPTKSEPELGQMWEYANTAPYAYVGEKRALVYGLALSPEKEYYKLGAYYQISDYQRKLVKAFDALPE
ncbi:aromatic prenyltransferase [Streptomyces sp. NBC_00015]|uniref:aromatic prenyltransferase n=1 Tax=unclassified Streptomyces TaxID=2593676 RepID=UPI0022528416|nr:aromatic prenyltransferase [Streptomyces sp. NBC_00103]MCX5372785.1 aromatic prenyltransferase [Streptomyces sp. NBC_00103]